jgi:membrane protease YdiL (CAAX protease family)
MGARLCAHCGAELAASSKFCGACGVPTRGHLHARHRQRRFREQHDRGVVAAIACVYGGVLLSLVVGWLLVSTGDGEVPPAAEWIFFALDVVVGGIAVALLNRGGGGALRASLANWPAARTWWWGPVAGVATMGFGLLYIEALLAVFGTQAEPLEPEAAPALGLLVLYTVILPPLLEEWLCRGVLWEALRRVANPRTTVVLTAFLFGMLHCLGGPLEFPHRFVGGLVLGWLRLRSGSLVPGIVAHGVHNALAVV